MFVAKNGTFLEKEFLAKEVSERTVQLDEIIESSAIVDRVDVPEVVPPVISMTEPEAPVLDTETSVKTVAEPRRTNRV